MISLATHYRAPWGQHRNEKYYGATGVVDPEPGGLTAEPTRNFSKEEREKIIKSEINRLKETIVELQAELKDELNEFSQKIKSLLQPSFAAGHTGIKLQIKNIGELTPETIMNLYPHTCEQIV